MSLSVEQFVVRLRDSGLFSDSDVQAFRSALRGEQTPASSDELAEQLVQQQRLTEYQAKAICLQDSNPLVLGEYVILDEIGRGGMGRVYKAFHRRMERTVAIKTLQPFTNVSKAIERFRREVKASARLIHPNVVTALDANEHEGTPYLVMEYIEGENLARVARRQGGFPVAEALEYTLQAARGIEYAHRRGIIHRDVKPANLLLTTDGTVKVLDLGLARFETGNRMGGETTQQADLTGVGDVIGTANYIAPEAACDMHEVDFRADIYSLGCTLYFLLTAEPIYGNHGDVIDKLFAHRKEPAPSLSDSVSGSPPWLNEIFQKMVAKDPDNRYQSMAEVIEVLSLRITELHIAAAQALEEPTATMPFAIIAEKERARRRVQAGIIGLLVLLIAVSAAGILFRLDTPAGTIVVETNEPGATVTLLDDQGNVEIRTQADGFSLKVRADVGRKELRVEKDGFQFSTREVTVTTKQGDPIRVALLPLQTVSTAVPVASAAQPAVDRRQQELAEWILARHGMINILRQSDESAEDARRAQAYQSAVERVSDLPETPYRVWRASFAQRYDFDDDDLSQLAHRFSSLGTLTNINLSQTAVTSAGLEHLTAFRDSLVELDLHDTPAAADESVVHLARCFKLQTLFLTAPAIGNISAAIEPPLSLTAVRRLKEQLPGCYIVWLPDRTVGLILACGGTLVVSDGEGIRSVSQPHDLPPPGFSIVGINFAQSSARLPLRDLRGLDKLQTLNLSATELHDGHLGMLRQWPLLQALDLSSTALTDAAVPMLSELTSLKSLRLVRTNLSVSAIQQLRASLPGCEIHAVHLE